MSSTMFNAFEPDPDELLRCLSRHVDDAMLHEIAAADYGQDIERHLDQLRRIRDDGSFEIPMAWHPMEVLELIRWSQPENPEWKPGAPGERGHRMRAFACAALLRASGETESRHLRDGWNETLIQLIDSLRVLGPAFDQPACSFLAWLILAFAQDPNDEEIDVLAVGLLWFGLHLRPPVSDEVVVSLAEWIAGRERRMARACGWETEHFLLGTIYGNQRRAAWKRLGDALRAVDLGGRAIAAQEWVALLGTELAGC